jgi:hypothetical protein
LLDGGELVTSLFHLDSLSFDPSSEVGRIGLKMAGAGCGAVTALVDEKRSEACH